MAKYQLRPYQERALRAIAQTRSNGSKTALAVMASGLGKTVVAGFDVRRFLRQKSGARVLYLCHQNDILKQARKTFEENILPQRHTHGYLTGQGDDIHEVTVLYASFQTMHRHRTLFKPTEFDYIVVDESHHGPARTYLPTLKYFRPKFLLAITATPERTDQQSIEDIYGAPVFELALEQAWAEGLLTPVDYRVVTDDWQNLKVLETPVGKLSITQLNKAIFAPKRDEEIVRIIEDKLFALPHPRVVIFSPRISHCEQLAAIQPGAVAIHSRMSEREQDERLEAFRNGETRAVITVDKFNEGIDVPEANVIVFLRSTASKTVFFQQLGRGLRLSKGKKQVLVLDFVANCDRLVMLEDLRQGVRERLETAQRFVNSDSPFEVDSGEFEFDEVARDVLTVIRTIRHGFTAEMLIAELQSLAVELGRTPKTADIQEKSKRGQGTSLPVFFRFFGSFNDALVAAGLEIGQIREYTKKMLISQLRQMNQELGHRPTEKEVNKWNREGRGARLDAFKRCFGIFEAALFAAGLSTSTKGKLILHLQALIEELGRNPRNREVTRKSSVCDGVSPGTYRYNFGSFNAALKLAGLDANRISYTDEELISQLQQMAEELGRVPRIRDVRERSKRRNDSAAYSTFLEHFGTFKAALLAAGLIKNK